MGTIAKAFLATIGVAVGLIVIVGIIAAAGSPRVRASLQQLGPSPAPTAEPTPTPPTFSMKIIGCGWPNLGGVQVGRTFHVVMSDDSVPSLPLNPLYFTVETPDRHVKRAGVLPYDLNQTALQLIELGPGQTADGWVFFDVAPIELTTLIFNDRFGHTESLKLSDYTLTGTTKVNCGSVNGT